MAEPTEIPVYITDSQAQEGLEKLSQGHKEVFATLLLDVLYDRFWCRTHDIDYCNPNVGKAKLKLYKELVELDYFIRHPIPDTSEQVLG